MGARDAMEFINEQDDATLQRFVERLVFRGRRSDVRRVPTGLR